MQIPARSARGQLTIPTEMIDPEIIKRFYENPYNPPILKITLDKIFLENGVTLESSLEGSVLILDVISMDVEVKEA